MAETIEAIYEKGMFRPLRSPGLQEHQRVCLLVLPEAPATLAASQRQALREIVGMGKSDHHDISTAHDACLSRKV
jgi:predicted DNA-binding antitoxin AbrB/MazE fold protein